MGDRRQIGEYDVVRLLGEGGMSRVYEVEDRRLGCRRALKLYSCQKSDSEIRLRFQAEGRLLARLCHPRIVRVTDFGIDEGSACPYFVMDLVLNERGETQSLADVEPGTADEGRIGLWYEDLREGLAYIHGQGVIHRDLKLQNVLIGPDGHAVLADFGIARILSRDGSVVPVADAVRTLAMVREGRRLVMGSIGYMAPELEMGVAASRQSDWYALGVIVYRLLTGTWCEARTDVTRMLEAYDPVWTRILPKLLHANPNGRECLSFAEERRILREREDKESADRLQAERRRSRVATRAAWVLLAAVMASFAGMALLGIRHRSASKALRDGPAPSVVLRPICSFDSLFGFPPVTGADGETDDGVPAEDDLEAARIDLLALTHRLLDQYNSGGMLKKDLIAKLEELQEHFDEDGNPDSLWPAGYVPFGDNETIRWMLGRAVEQLQE